MLQGVHIVYLNNGSLMHRRNRLRVSQFVAQHTASPQMMHKGEKALSAKRRDGNLWSGRLRGKIHFNSMTGKLDDTRTIEEDGEVELGREEETKTSKIIARPNVTGRRAGERESSRATAEAGVPSAHSSCSERRVREKERE